MSDAPVESPPVVPHAHDAAQDRAAERHDRDDRRGGDARDGHHVVGEGDAPEDAHAGGLVEPAEHERDHRDEDTDRDRPHPDGDALRHAAERGGAVWI